MNSFTDLHHIIIGFYKGAGGNFVGRILAGLQHNVLDPILLTPEGSAHYSSDEGLKVVSWSAIESSPTLPPEQQLEGCINYIKNSSLNKSPIVIITHETWNLAILKTIMPNTKIATIVMTNPDDIVIAEANFIKKWFMAAAFSHDFEKIANVKQRARDRIRGLIIRDTGRVDIADKILDRTAGYLYSDILLHYYMSMQRPIRYDNIIGVTFKGSVEIPFACIRHNDEAVFLESIEQVHGEPLNTDQIEFVRNEFRRYQTTQNKALMTDPREYKKQLAVTASEQLKELIDSTPNK